MTSHISGHVSLVKRKRGDAWHVKYRLADGKQVKKKLGPAWTTAGRPPAGYFTKRTAQEALQEILTDARRGTLANVGASGATFADAAAEYLRFVESVRKLDPNTARDYRSAIKRQLLPEFGELPLEKVTPDLIDAFKERLIGEGRVGNRTIVRYLTVLHGIFKRARRVWGIRENPASADLVERPRVEYTGEFDTFDWDEIELLAASADNDRDAALYKAAAFTGLRTGELLGLKWGDVDFVAGLVHVRRSYDYKHGVEKVPKGKRVRSVPLMAELVDVLATLKDREHFTEDGDLVFCSEVGEHLDYYEHLARYKASLKRAGLRAIRFHDLRHAFGSAAITKLDPYAVQSYMGHQHYSTTQRYLHHKPRREDAARLSDAFRVPNQVPNLDSSGVTESNSEHQSVPERPQGSKA
jgi:integrase